MCFSFALLSENTFGKARGTICVKKARKKTKKYAVCMYLSDPSGFFSEAFGFLSDRFGFLSEAFRIYFGRFKYL